MNIWHYILKILNSPLFGAIITILIALFGVWLIIYFAETAEAPTNLLEIKEFEFPLATTTLIEVKPSQFPDYDALAGLKVMELIKDKESSVRNMNDDDITNIRLNVKGRFSRMYLYSESSVDRKPLTDWDSLYVKFNTYPPVLAGYKNGGHLYRPKSLAIPKDSQASRLLYNMSVVPYLPTVPYSETRVPITVNWFDLVFKNEGIVTSTVRFDTFLNTKRYGIIHLIAIYYDCEPETPECFIQKVEGNN